MDQRAQLFIDRIGMHWEGEGLPRIAGRIFGFLFLQPEPCSLDDLASALGVSKASVSTDARRLEQLGLLERVGRPGDRRDYYALAHDAPKRILSLKLRGMERFRQLVQALDMPDADPAVRRRLETFEKVQEMIAHSITELIERLERSGLLDYPSSTSGASGAHS